MEVALGSMENPLAAGPMSAEAKGLQLLQSAKRVDLKRLMRARDDPTFVRYMEHMRRTDADAPIPEELLDGLEAVTDKDVQNDGAWRFAPIGVLSHIERDSINHSQLHAFAQFFNLPVICWRHELVDQSFAEEEVREQLFQEEKNLWGYFVEGAPVHLLETIKSVRKLVNGSPGLLDSVVAANEADQSLIRTSYQAGYATVILEAPPRAVNIIVGGSKEAPRLWHEVPLEDLSSLLPDYIEGEQIIPVQVSKAAEDAECTSMFAAQEDLPPALKVKQHQYGFAFALTDYKLQGRTLEKLVLSLCFRSKQPTMTLAAFYVLVSRVRKRSGLRLLLRDEAGIKQLRQKKHKEELHAWENGYRNGKWDGERAVKAYCDLVTRRAASSKKMSSAKTKKKPPAQKKERKPKASQRSPPKLSPRSPPKPAPEQPKTPQRDLKSVREEMSAGDQPNHSQEDCKPRGMLNPAGKNACFFNSVIQILANIEGTSIHYSHSPQFRWPKEDENTGEVSQAFKSLLKALKDSHQKFSVNPFPMKKILGRHIPLCGNDEQQGPIP